MSEGQYSEYWFPFGDFGGVGYGPRATGGDTIPFAKGNCEPCNCSDEFEDDGEPQEAPAHTTVRMTATCHTDMDTVLSLEVVSSLDHTEGPAIDFTEEGENFRKLWRTMLGE